jgi:hypothetical protein
MSGGGDHGSGRAGAWDAAHTLAAESAQADFVYLLRRIHSLCKADGTLSVETPPHAPGTGRQDRHDSWIIIRIIIVK